MEFPMPRFRFRPTPFPYSHHHSPRGISPYFRSFRTRLRSGRKFLEPDVPKGSPLAKASLRFATNGIKSSSGAVLFGIRLPHFEHSCTMTYPRPFRTSRSTAGITPPHEDARSPGNSSSKCKEARQDGQWLRAEPSGCVGTFLPHETHRNGSFFITKDMGLD